LVDRALSEYDLVATGGTDAHEMELGRSGLDKSSYRPIAAVLERTED